MRRGFLFVLTFALLLSTAWAQSRSRRPRKYATLPSPAMTVLHDVNDGRIKADIRFLSSDLLEGRGTGARGGDLAAHYIADQFEQAGLKPLGANGGYLQDVPMLGVTTLPESTMTLTT